MFTCTKSYVYDCRRNSEAARLVLLENDLDKVEPDNNQALEGALGSEIDYEIGEYKVIGVINGEQTVVQSVVTREE